MQMDIQDSTPSSTPSPTVIPPNPPTQGRATIEMEIKYSSPRSDNARGGKMIIVADGYNAPVRCVGDKARENRGSNMCACRSAAQGSAWPASTNSTAPSAASPALCNLAPWQWRARMLFSNLPPSLEESLALNHADSTGLHLFKCRLSCQKTHAAILFPLPDAAPATLWTW